MNIAKNFKNSFFFIEHLQWLLLADLLRYSKVSWGFCSLIQCLHVFPSWPKPMQNIAQIIVYCHITKQFLPCLNCLIMYFRFHNMFGKDIGCFWFWWKTYAKGCTNSNVISHIKRLSLPLPCSWSGASNFRIWFGKWENAV